MNLEADSTHGQPLRLDLQATRRSGSIPHGGVRRREDELRLPGRRANQLKLLAAEGGVMSEFAQVIDSISEIHANRLGIREGIGQFLPRADRDGLVARLTRILHASIETDRWIDRL